MSSEKIPSKDALEEKHGQPDKWDSQNSNPDSPSADFRALIDAITAEGRAYRKEEEREEGRKSFREWITILLIFATLIAVSWQVHEMVKVYDPIKKQADASASQVQAAITQAEAAASQVAVAVNQAQAAITQANAAKKSAQFAASSIAISEKEFFSSHRAWVGPTDTAIVDKETNGSPIVGKPIAVKITYGNFGREPAEMTENFWIWKIPSSFYGSPDFSQWTTQHALPECKAVLLTGPLHIIYPTGETAHYSFIVPSDADWLKDKSSDGRFVMDDQIKDGSAMIISTTCFTYKTQGKIHHSLFCFYYKAKDVPFEHLGYCPTGQYTD